jgi:CheY-like chemotaxis protein
MKILLAEDAEESALVIQAYLQKTPHRLDLAQDGSQAFELFVLERYDLVLMDHEMPIMNGITATRKIRAWEREHNKPPTPVVVLTAHTVQDIEGDTMGAGYDMHLTKPISKSRLLEVVDHFAAPNKKPAGVR